MKGSLVAAAAATIVFACPQPASAQYVDGNGRAWQHAVNRNGMVLRSGPTVIYLGRNCDASSPRYGPGRWEWANGGFSVIFRGIRLAFSRQEVPARMGLGCRA
jgi:hypothetical protein